MKGYKVFNPDMTCRDFQYEVGKDYKIDGDPIICSTGFHFCTKAAHCFSYYSFNSKNIVCEVEALGVTVTHGEDSKVATNHIKIIRILDWSEVLSVSNDGSNNTGHSNTGNWNTGNWNTGNSNTGNWNTGNWNTGDRNTGDWNTGNWNTGDRNTGDWNTGNWNTGDWNTGNWNTGNWNTGNWNTGNWNTGDRNTGDWNTGNRNTGDRNTGNWNTGNSNTGYSNTGNRNTGAFCTGDAPFTLFNKKTSMTEDAFKNTRAFRLMKECVNTKIWVPLYAMNDEEKEAYPASKTAEGYVKDIPFKEAFQNAWHNWDDNARSEFTKLPNFNKKIFFDITGVNI